MYIAIISNFINIETNIIEVYYISITEKITYAQVYRATLGTENHLKIIIVLL